MLTEKNVLESLDDLLFNGPLVEDYPFVNAFFNEQYKKDPYQFINKFKLIRERVPAFNSADAIAGFCYLQPHGYAGDFEIIDRLYTNYKGPGQSIARWDTFAQAQPAAQAVRNRKSYFIELLAAVKPHTVLNLASGPCRDLLEYFQKYPYADILIDCIELDEKAIAYARKLLSNDARLNFIRQNALLYKPVIQYDLVWSAGLFDYFVDRVFVRVLRKLMDSVVPGGQVVIGNFAANNPNKAFMEVGMNWFLHHRSAEHLMALAEEAGAKDWKVDVHKEPSHVNLFLHLKKPL